MYLPGICSREPELFFWNTLPLEITKCPGILGIYQDVFFLYVCYSFGASWNLLERQSEPHSDGRMLSFFTCMEDWMGLLPVPPTIQNFPWPLLQNLAQRNLPKTLGLLWIRTSPFLECRQTSEVGGGHLWKRGLGNL